MADELKVFTYKAKHRDGRLIEGKTKAFSTAQVSEYLIQRAYIPLVVQEQSGLQRDISFGQKRVKPKEVASFFRQFSTMISAGLPLSRSLTAMRDQQSNQTLRSALTRIILEVETGSAFNVALAAHPQIFSPLTIAMIRAGEDGGFLEKVLRQVAQNLESDVKLRQKIKSAMTYPVAVFILAILIVAAMLLFIVPVFAGLFSSLGGNLPLPTQILVILSDALKIFAIPLIILGIVGTILWNKNKHRREMRAIIDPIKLKLPIFGNLTRKLVAARFARNFGSLLEAGLPLPQVFEIVGATSGSIVLEDALRNVRNKVMTGEQIAPQMAQYDIFPRMLVEMVAVGESTGQIPDLMLNIADAYDDEVETIAESLASLLEPIMLVVLGVLVGAVVIALYMPIFSIYSLIEDSA